MTDEPVETPKKKILVIDDQYPIRELLETLLEDDYDVIKAENAEEARFILRDHVDLITLDIMMPDFDGYAFCKELKESIATKHIPVLILTAKHLPKDLELAKNAGGPLGSALRPVRGVLWGYRRRSMRTFARE